MLLKAAIADGWLSNCQSATITEVLPSFDSRATELTVVREEWLTVYAALYVEEKNTMALKILMPGIAQPKGILPCTVEFTYFNVGKGRADPLEQMF